MAGGMGRHKDPKLVKGLRMVANGSKEWAAFVASGKPTSWKNFLRAVRADTVSDMLDHLLVSNSVKQCQSVKQRRPTVRQS